MKRNNKNGDRISSCLSSPNFDVLCDISKGAMSANLLRSIYCYGYEHMSPLQQNVIPELLKIANDDTSKIPSCALIRGAPGTGKTSCGLIAAIHLFDQIFLKNLTEKNNMNQFLPHSPSVLILCRQETRAWNVLGLLKGLARFSFVNAAEVLKTRKVADDEIFASDEGQCPFTVTMWTNKPPLPKDKLSESDLSNDEKIRENDSRLSSFEEIIQQITCNPYAFFLVATPERLAAVRATQASLCETACYPGMLRNIKMVIVDKGDEIMEGMNVRTKSSNSNNNNNQPTAAAIATSNPAKTSPEVPRDLPYPILLDSILCELAPCAKVIFLAGEHTSNNDFTCPNLDFTFARYVIRPSVDGEVTSDSQSPSSSCFIYSHLLAVQRQEREKLFLRRHYKSPETANNWLPNMMKHFFVEVQRDEYKLETVFDLFEYYDVPPPNSSPRSDSRMAQSKIIIFVSTNRKARWLLDSLIEKNLIHAAGAAKNENRGITTGSVLNSVEQTVDEQKKIIREFKSESSCLRVLIMSQSCSASINPKVLKLLKETEHDDDDDDDDCFGDNERGNNNDGGDDDDDHDKRKTPEFSNLLTIAHPKTRFPSSEVASYLLLHYDLPLLGNYENFVRDRLLMMKPASHDIQRQVKHQIISMFFVSISDQCSGIDEIENSLKNWVTHFCPGQETAPSIVELPMDFENSVVHQNWYQ